MTFSRNNLDRASSPYLRQHADNPVWWQEWNEETLEFARANDRILFVSVGYSTCHWCHVMAREAFSDADSARILNRYFLPVKVDREQRPDIDHFLMSFLVGTTGSGGWPLNAFLTPDGRPFFAMTYASTEPRFNTPAFSDILGRVIEFHAEHKDEISAFELDREHSRVSSATLAALSATTGANESDELPLAMISDEDEQEALSRIADLDRAYDRVHGGFGSSQKFPPHSPLLFLQYAHAAGLSDEAAAMVTGTLDAMMTRGLHDHLQGGFFRYTVDNDWTIPHFEKMLYDQALLLWNYSIASRLFGRTGYRETAKGIIRSLEETFRVGAGYASAHDADTNHREGATYIWKLEEIEQCLTAEEFDAILREFSLSTDGNFERRNHLVRILAPGTREDHPDAAKRAPSEALVGSAMDKLLAARRERDQPDRDDKIVLGWNALVGCGLLAAHRYAGIETARDRALELADYLVSTFVSETGVAHVALGDQLQKQEFLADIGALLLFLTMLAEEGPELDERYRDTRTLLEQRLASLHDDGVWIESRPTDFAAVPAEPFDQPVPSGMALAELALLLRQVRSHEDYAPRPFADAHGQAFANLAALASRGYFYVVESPEVVAWESLPVNSVQVSGAGRSSCYRGVCYIGLPPSPVPANARSTKKKKGR